MRTRAFIVAALAAVGTTACGSTGAPVQGEPGATTVVVDNNQVGASALTVYLVSDLGRRDMLGTVTPGERETFVFSGDVRLGEYRLVALDTGGRDVASRPFTLFDKGSVVSWNVAMKSLRVNRTETATM